MGCGSWKPRRIEEYSFDSDLYLLTIMSFDLTPLLFVLFDGLFTTRRRISSSLLFDAFRRGIKQHKSITFRSRLFLDCTAR